jgi:predicted secreted protein
MSIPIGVAVYLSIWFTVLFAVLPFGVRSLNETGEEIPLGADPGAPVAPQLVRKAIWTTLVSAIVFAFVAFIMIRYG